MDDQLFVCGKIETLIKDLSNINNANLFLFKTEKIASLRFRAIRWINKVNIM